MLISHSKAAALEKHYTQTVWKIYYYYYYYYYY